MSYALITLLLFTCACIGKAQVNYCEKPCPDPEDKTGTKQIEHILCKYKPDDWGNDCGKTYPEVSTISEEDKNIIVNTHNTLRRKVAKGEETRGTTGPQPPAADIRELIWDDELALMAQTQAQQCLSGHYGCKDVSRFRVSQNIRKLRDSDSLKAEWERTIESWYSEVKDMNINIVRNFSFIDDIKPKDVGHYTQVIYYSSYTVGCGLAVHSPNNAPHSIYKKYVCNYGPAGNWRDSRIYEEGVAGSKCPEGTYNNDGLCATTIESYSADAGGGANYENPETSNANNQEGGGGGADYENPETSNANNQEGGGGGANYENPETSNADNQEEETIGYEWGGEEDYVFDSYV